MIQSRISLTFNIPLIVVLFDNVVKPETFNAPLIVVLLSYVEPNKNNHLHKMHNLNYPMQYFVIF
jgi:hypothetical protein